jgi:hypothetical protein
VVVVVVVVVVPVVAVVVVVVPVVAVVVVVVVVVVPAMCARPANVRPPVLRGHHGCPLLGQGHVCCAVGGLQT